MIVNVYLTIIFDFFSAPLTQSILPVLQQPTIIPNRQLTKFSLKKGKRKSVRPVLHRFFRLHW